MDKVIKNLNIAKELIEDKDKYREDYSYYFRQIYPFTTENLKGHYQFFNLKGKDALTVQGSGDQILELRLNGVTNIDAFDINSLTEFYFDLKRAALKAQISKLEFLEFFRYNDYPRFGPDNKKCFNHETFLKIKDFLQEDSYCFWMNLFLTYPPEKIRRKNYLFSDDESREDIFKETLNYYQEDKYKELCTLINDLNYHFIESDIRNLPNILTKEYDFIDLSNIIRYSEKIWNQNPLENYRNLIDKLVPFLKPNGNMIVGYLYQADTECSNYECYQSKLRNQYFPLTEYKYYYFNGVYDIKHQPQKKDNDAILVYHKR